MKNKLVLYAVFLILLVSVLGCGWISPFGGSSDSTNSGDAKTGETSTVDDTIDAVIVEKTGVAECDELMAYISQLAKSEDDNYVTKATREFFLNRIREGIRKNVEENKGNPEEMAKHCKEYKTQLETYKKEEDAKKQNQ